MSKIDETKHTPPHSHAVLESSKKNKKSSKLIDVNSSVATASSFGSLVPVTKKNNASLLFDADHLGFINELKKNSSNNSNNTLTRQFFTLGLLEYVCNILNPKDPVSANKKFKGIIYKMLLT